MIDYLSQHTDYKVLTNDEYQLLRPVAQSSPWVGGARPKTTEGTRPKTTFKFEEEEEDEPTTHQQSGFVFDSSTVRPRFSTFSGEEKCETSFDVWKNDVECALRDGVCSPNIILQSIRSSLKGKARSLLLTLPTDATPAQILTKLDGVFGNIYPTEKLIQQFYATQQEERETVVDYGLRLECILQRCIERKAISLDARNEMLRTKLWSGLKDSNFRNSSRYKYDTIKDFEALRRELRTIELDLQLSSSSTATSSEKKKQQVSKIGKGDDDSSLELILQKLEAMDKRIGDVEREVKRVNTKDRYPTSTEQNSTKNYNHTGNRSHSTVRGYYYGRGRGQFRGGNRGTAIRGQSYPHRGGFNRGYRRDLNY